MPYETKPMKKQWLEIDGIMTPIILPQIWNHELQDWVVTSEKDPLPTQVTGSNVENQILVNALAITDVEYHEFTVLNSDKYKRIIVLYRSTLDQSVQLRLRERSGRPFWSIPKNDRLSETWGELEPTQNKVIANYLIPELDKVASERLNLSFRSSTAPTTGALTVIVMGVK